MIRDRSLLWAGVIFFVVQHAVGVVGQILQVPFPLRIVLMYVATILIAGLWVLARYRALAPVRVRAEQLRSAGAVVIPVLLDPISAPVGAASDEGSRRLAFAIATPLGLEIRNTDDSTVLTAEWAEVSNVRFGHSSPWTPNITVDLDHDGGQQEWWLVPVNVFGFRFYGRRSPVFDLIDELEQLRTSARADA